MFVPLLKIAYYLQALNSIWNDPNIVAITPFLLQANGGAFQKFSFTNVDGSPTRQYQMLKELPNINIYQEEKEGKLGKDLQFEYERSGPAYFII